MTAGPASQAQSRVFQRADRHSVEARIDGQSFVEAVVGGKKAPDNMAVSVDKGGADCNRDGEPVECNRHVEPAEVVWVSLWGLDPENWSFENLRHFQEGLTGIRCVVLVIMDQPILLAQFVGQRMDLPRAAKITIRKTSFFYTVIEEGTSHRTEYAVIRWTTWRT